MSVFHLSGLGLNPGAVTVPLTYIYFLLKQCREGDKKAIEFFKYSGEENETLKGKPEALIIFTSKEVIEGKVHNEIIDKLFNTRKQKSIPYTIMRYFQNLIKGLDFKNSLFGEFGMKYLCFVEVDINNFEDCYRKIYLTLKGIKGKEIECNLIGGTNQINLSLMLAGSITGVVAKYYYVFEKDNKLLHSGLIENKKQRMPVPPKNWYEIPPLFLSYGELIEELKNIGILEKPVNVNQIKKTLEKFGLGIEKFFGRWIVIDGEKAKAGQLLRRVLNFHKNIEEETKKEEIVNFSKWKNYFKSKNWLYTFIEKGKECKK